MSGDVESRRETTRSVATRVATVLPVVLLVIVWVVSVYRGGSYAASSWLPLAVLVAFGAVVVAGFKAYPRRPRRPVLVILGLLFLYTVCVALSTTWALGASAAWVEATRAGFYLVFFALMVLYLTQAEGRIEVRLLLVGVALLFVIVSLVRLSAPALSLDFFAGRRFQFPVTYPNGSGSFYLLLVWPLLWVAAGPRDNLAVRGVALGCLAALLQMAFLTESRGAAAALVLSGLFYFVVTPGRLRSFLSLAVPVIMLGAAWGPLSTYYSLGAEKVNPALAPAWIGASFVVSAVAGAVIAFLDGRLPIGRRVRTIASAAVLAALIAGAAVGTVALQARVGDLGAYVRTAASNLVRAEDDAGNAGIAGSRFGLVGGGGRGYFWSTAWKGFEDAPVAGNGAGSYPYVNELYRTKANLDARQAHSIEFDQLSDTGIVGFVLFSAAFIGGMAVCLTPRSRSLWAFARRRRPWFVDLKASEEHPHPRGARDAWVVALLAGGILWIVHASVDWLWHIPGVTLGALFLLAWALTAATTPHRKTKRRRSPVLSWGFRVGLGVTAVGAVVFAGLPYVSAQYGSAAYGSASTVAGVERTATAHALFPLSPDPFWIRADLYRSAAETAAAGTAAGQAAAGDGKARAATQTRQYLALAAAAEERAAEEDVYSSLAHARTALAILDLLAVRDPSAAVGDRAQRWAALGLPRPAVPETVPEQGAGGLEESRLAADMLALTDAQLLARAHRQLLVAQMRNPLQAQVNDLLSRLTTALGGT